MRALITVIISLVVNGSYESPYETIKVSFVFCSDGKMNQLRDKNKSPSPNLPKLKVLQGVLLAGVAYEVLGTNWAKRV